MGSATPPDTPRLSRTAHLSAVTGPSAGEDPARSAGAAIRTHRLSKRYGEILLAFVWELFGSLLNVPAWTLDLSPFHQVGLVPAQSFKATAAIVMLAIAGLAALAALRMFERRDLTGS
jgi:hypothetical protein